MTRRGATKPVRRKQPTLAQRRAELDRRIALATHQAAKLDRLTRDWKARVLSADAAVIPDLKVLHARARALVRDDPYAASAVRAFRRNVVGAGIRAAPARKSADGVLDDAWNRGVSELWEAWSKDPSAVDAEGRRTFAEIQRWCVDELVQVGEALVVRCYKARSDGLPGLMLQCVEAEQLDMDLVEWKEGDGPTRQVRGGVEIDEYGRAVAYHLKPETFPGLTIVDRKSIRKPAEDVIHVMEPGRARQTRGTGRFTSVMLKLRDLGQYDYAQLTAARAEACIGIVVETPTTDASFGGTNPDGSPGADELTLLPLTTMRTQPGEKITPFAPTRPGGTYEPFIRAQLKAVAAGLGISYEQIARDFTNGTYSSQRQAMLEDRREFKVMQELLIAQLCQPVYDDFVRDAALKKLVQFDANEYATRVVSFRRVLWMPDGWQWIDPEKEANADKAALDSGFVTLEELALERGRDWREIAQQRANEQAYIAGIKPVAPAAPGTEGPNGQ